MLHALGAHSVGEPAPQLPPLHVSLFVQALPSEHAAPSLPATLPQPLTASQVSTVHGFASVQSRFVGVPAHLPLAHLSLWVQETSSLQLAVLNVGTQPVAGTQVSSVQTSPSLHVNALPLHKPLAQASALVQALLSVQDAPSLPAGLVQPVAGSQPSAVHGSPSLQVMAEPLQAWATHVSPLVQALPSLHAVLASASLCLQPTLAVQLSIEHGLPSSQLSTPVGTHAPRVHVSPVVHGSPSVQATVLFWCTQPMLSAHPSDVQNVLSSQFGGAPPTQLLLLHVSLVVHALPSLQSEVLAMCTQPLPSAQESFVQPLPSSQLSALPEQTPPEHLSFRLQIWPSSQDLPSSLVNVQPLVGSQPSSVHALLSLHVRAAPPLHLPLPHVSLVVHALLSSQARMLFVNTHPVAAVHVSFVHGLLSLHGGFAVPLHAPWLHASPPVHASLSLQVPVMGALLQPLAGLQLSSVQTLLSSQFAGVAVHVPVTHVSPVVQASPSLHASPLSLVYWQPPVLLQTSVVHGFLSSHWTVVNWLQPLSLHVSPAVHASPSSQVTLLAR